MKKQKKDHREPWQIIDDIWAKLKAKDPDVPIPLRIVDIKAGLKVGTCSALYYGDRPKTSIHKQALIECEKGIK